MQADTGYAKVEKVQGLVSSTTQTQMCLSSWPADAEFPGRGLWISITVYSKDVQQCRQYLENQPLSHHVPFPFPVPDISFGVGFCKHPCATR